MQQTGLLLNADCMAVACPRTQMAVGFGRLLGKVATDRFVSKEGKSEPTFWPTHWQPTLRSRSCEVVASR